MDRSNGKKEKVLVSTEEAYERSERSALALLDQRFACGRGNHGRPG